MNVARHDVWPGALRCFMRNSFEPKACLDVKFAGEIGMDEGGPTRDLMSLLVEQIKMKPIFEDCQGHAGGGKEFALSAAGIKIMHYM